jgi:hypothetical protein
VRWVGTCCAYVYVHVHLRHTMQRRDEEQAVLRDDEVVQSPCHWTEQSVRTRGDLSLDMTRRIPEKDTLV